MNLTSPERTRSRREDSLALRSEPGARPASSPWPLLWLTVLSLDAPAVAVLWQLLFARSFRVPLSPDITILLAMVVWLIYVADRALDTLKVPFEGAEPARHIFYRRHVWVFLVPFSVVFVLAAWMSLTKLDPRTFRNGIVILLAVGAYFLVTHLLSPGRERLPKEMLVGVLFALGTCFPVWEHASPGASLMLAPYLIFTALCWLNCVAIEYEEWTRLRHRQFGPPHSWTIWMGRHFSFITFATAVIAAGLIASGFGRPTWQLLTCELVSALALALIRYKHKSLSTDKFRVLMDLALFTPLLFLPF
ncbi:MAG: hypothetical protein P8Z30_05400 [Acidobacteriota bacterium]